MPLVPPSTSTPVNQAAGSLYGSMPKPVQSIIDFFTPGKTDIPFSPTALGAVVGNVGTKGLVGRLLEELAARQSSTKGLPAAVQAAPKALYKGYLSNSTGPVESGAKTLEEIMLKRGIDLSK